MSNTGTQNCEFAEYDKFKFDLQSLIDFIYPVELQHPLGNLIPFFVRFHKLITKKLLEDFSRSVFMDH
jgi:hypothetical protein